MIYNLCLPVEAGGRGMRLNEVLDLTMGQLEILCNGDRYRHQAEIGDSDDWARIVQRNDGGVNDG